MEPFLPMANRLTPGKKGVAELSIFEVSREDAEFSRIRAVATQGREQPVPMGKYAKLTVEGRLMMTDTPMEQRTNLTFLRKARGNVLVAGLGIGMVLEPLLRKPEVDTVLVIEKFQDVIDLVTPSFKKAIANERLHVFNEDIFTFRPNDAWMFDTIYFDIWPTISGDNLPEMERLHNLFRYHLESGGWMSSWEYNLLKERYSEEADEDEDEEVDYGDEVDDEEIDYGNEEDDDD